MNKKLKRMLSVALAVVTFVCISGQIAVFADGNDNNMQKQYDAMEFLRQLEIIPDYYDYNTNFSSNVSRADFAVAAARAVKTTEYSGQPYYYDVSELHWAYREISALTAKGVLDGTGNKLFRPDDLITKPEAYKIILTAIGYGDWARMNGGYPQGYMNTAITAELTEGVSSDNEVSVGDMFMIIYNSLKTRVPEIVSSGGNIKYSTSSEKTILGLYWDMYYNKGILSGINGICFDGRLINDGYVCIDDEIYLTELSMDEYLGEEIQFFYEKSDKNEVGKVIWAKPIGKKSNTLLVNVNYDASFDEDKFVFTYYDSDKKRDKNIRIKKGATVIYNGSITGENLAKLLDDGKYTVKFVGNKSSEYDTILIREYENYYVGGINTNDELIYESGTGLTYRELNLKPSEYHNFRMSLYGTPKTFSDIKKGDVLSVYKSLDGSIIDIHIVTEKISGKIEAIESKDKGKNVKINGENYFIPSYAGGAEISVNQSATLYLDDGGDVAFVERTSGAYTASYLVNMYSERNDKIMCKLFLDSGELVHKELNSTVTVDGLKCKDYSAYEKLSNGDSFTPRFAMVTLNKDDKISMIDTVETGDGGSKDVLRANISYVKDCAYNKNSLENYAVLNDNTVIFFIPSDERIKHESEQHFRVGKKSDLTNWVYYNIETYATTERVGYEQYVVIKGADDASEKNRTDKLPMLIKDFEYGINSDDEPARVVVGYIGSEEVEMVLGENVWEEQFDGKISEGDIIRIAADSNNEIQMAELLFDEDNPSIKITAYNSTFGESRGYAHDLTDGILRITRTKGLFANGDRTVDTAGVPCLIYDSSASRRGRITYGSIEQARTYMDTGEDCSMIYEMQTKGIPKIFVVYLYPKM